MRIPSCRTCGSNRVKKLGNLPDVAEFAGVTLPQPLAGGVLWRCHECRFVFRDPLLHDSEYERLYTQGTPTAYESKEERIDFDLVRTRILRTSAVDVLDVGCFTGAFLASLPDRFRRFGIEPNERAAEVARNRGISIIAESLDELAGERKFDAVTACDVIEHVVDPASFLLRIKALLKPGGRIFVSTGDSEAWPWQLARANYWYCYFPEHISFISPTWLAVMSNKLGLRVVSATAFNYRFRRASLPSLRTLLGGALYATSPTVYFALRRGVNANSKSVSPPMFGHVKDHFLAELVCTDEASFGTSSSA